METQKCSICKEQYYGYGHNAQPVNNGRCSGDCNAIYVIPARMNAMGISFPPKNKEADNGVV
jgi:hypothetical protein